MASADGACADSVEWLLAEMLRGNTAGKEGLPQRLQREGFWEALGSRAHALRSASSAEREGLLKAMWRHVRCVWKFSVGRCNMLLAESRQAAAQAPADGHDVTVALGYTGAGKTTLMHVLRGSRFKEDYKGYHVLLGKDANGLLVGDNNGRSKTRFVRLVKDVEGRLLADSPGFQDTDGPEVEVANVLGVAEFLQACRSVRLVVVVNAEQFGKTGRGLRLLAGMLGSLLRDPAAAMRSTTFLYTKEQGTTHQAMYKKVCDVYKVAVQEDDKTIQCILGELKRQAVHPRLDTLDSGEDFEEDWLEDAADGKAVLLRPCGGDRYDLVYGEHGTVHRTTVSLPHIEPGSRLKLDQKLRGELIAAVEAAGAPPLFLGACVSVRPLDPACAGRVLRAVQARPAVQAPCNVFGVCGGLRQETTLAVREQALVDVKSIQSSVAYCAGLAGGGGACTGAQQEGVQGAPAEEGGAQQEAAAVWRIVGWRLERLAATYELLQDDHVGRALQEAQNVVRTSLQQRLDDAVHHLARVAGPDSRLREEDTQQVQRAIDGFAAARMVVEKLVPDVSWDMLDEKVQWHLRESARVADAALKENKPQQAGVALEQLQLLAEQTRVAVPSDGRSAADVRDAAVRCGQQHFDGLCAAVQQRIKEGALHSTEALQGTATALSDMCVHHKHLHAVLHLGDLDSTAYTLTVEALCEGLVGLTEACARDADELARLQVRDDARQQQLVAELRDRLAVLAEAEAVCSQHIDVPVLHAFVRGAQGACVAAVDTLCGRAERAVKGGVETGTGSGSAEAEAVARTQQNGAVQTHAQEVQGDDAQLCLDIVEEVRQVDYIVTAESLGRYTDMQARVNAAAAVAVAEVRRLVDMPTADGAEAGNGAVQRDQAAVLVQYIEQLQRQPALSRYNGLLAHLELLPRNSGARRELVALNEQMKKDRETCKRGPVTRQPPQLDRQRLPPALLQGWMERQSERQREWQEQMAVQQASFQKTVLSALALQRGDAE